MTIRTKYEVSVLPPSPMFTLYITNSLVTHKHENSVTITFKILSKVFLNIDKKRIKKSQNIAIQALV